jgi:hypothetical protein
MWFTKDEQSKFMKLLLLGGLFKIWKKLLLHCHFLNCLFWVLICVGFIHWQSCDGDTTTTTTTLYSSPLAQITPAITVFGLKPAPEMASFSSQGPNSLVPDILKVRKRHSLTVCKHLL